MTNIVDFNAKKLEKSPHVAGTAICGGCKYEWGAVAPLDRDAKWEMACPSCGAHRGIWKYNFSTDKPTIECPSCTGHLFKVAIDHVYCVGCGNSATFKTIFGE